MNNKFSSQIYATVDMSKFKPQEYFTEYHFYEPYDDNKNYNLEKFKTKYGDHDESTYRYKLYTLNDNVKYVVAEETLSSEELDELAKYCRCSYHNMSWLNPLKLVTCPCCVGCLESAFPSQYVINASREYKKNKQNSYCSFS